MTIRELLARIQRKFVALVFLAWVAAWAAMLMARPQTALLASVAAIAFILAAFVYLWRSARCPRCAARLWLLLHKLVPFSPFQPKLNHCPSCGVSVSESAGV